MSKKNKKTSKNKLENSIDNDAFDLSQSQTSQSLDKGTRTVKDIFAPAYIGQPAPDHLIVGSKYVRSYGLQGYPMNVYVR